MTTAKDMMFNWSRDFIQVYTHKDGFCEEKAYNETFKRFKKSYGFDGKPLDLLRELKENGFISRSKGKLVWLLPIAEQNKR